MGSLLCDRSLGSGHQRGRFQLVVVGVGCLVSANRGNHRVVVYSGRMGICGDPNRHDRSRRCGHHAGSDHCGRGVLSLCVWVGAKAEAAVVGVSGRVPATTVYSRGTCCPPSSAFLPEWPQLLCTAGVLAASYACVTSTVRTSAGTTKP